MQLIVFPIGAPVGRSCHRVARSRWAPVPQGRGRPMVRALGKVGICIVRLCKQAVGRSGSCWCSFLCTLAHLDSFENRSYRGELKSSRCIANCMNAGIIVIAQGLSLLAVAATKSGKGNGPKTIASLRRRERQQESVTAAEGEVALSGIAATSKETMKRPEDNRQVMLEGAKEQGNGRARVPSARHTAALGPERSCAPSSVDANSLRCSAVMVLHVNV